MVYHDLFPDVNFDDKIAVRFKSGREIVLKHLYFDASELEKINWNDVSECWEV